MKLNITILLLLISVVACQIPGGWNKIDAGAIPDVVKGAALASKNIMSSTFIFVNASSQVANGWNYYKFAVKLDKNRECKFSIFYSGNVTFHMRERSCTNPTEITTDSGIN